MLWTAVLLGLAWVVFTAKGENPTPVLSLFLYLGAIGWVWLTAH